MFASAVMLLRYLFLLLLFVFIFRLVKWMMKDLEDFRAQQKAFQARPLAQISPEPGGSRLVVNESSSQGIEPGDYFSIGEEIRIGRDAKSDIVITDPFASSQHARVYLNKEQYWLEDTGSTNGTFLNEVQVKQPIVLANGDRIRIGSVTFQFVRWGHEVGSAN